MKYIEKNIFRIAFLFIIVAPYLFTRNWGLISFDNTGQIGDTIGGITAPIVGLVSIYLLYHTLIEQSKFNKQQTEFNKQQSIIAHNEQFKTTLFSLLQEQRDIMEKMQGVFCCLNKQDTREEVNVQRNGLFYFKDARNQLKLLFETLDTLAYSGSYDIKDAILLEDLIHQKEMTSPFLRDGAPIEERKAVLMEISDMRSTMHICYTNDIYEIDLDTYNKYNALSSLKEKIAFAYLLFYCKYEDVGHYFRHLYHILKFIKISEDEEVKMCENSMISNGKKEIQNKYRQYAQFIQSQMSINEQVLCFYNSFAFEKLQELIIYYGLMENLTIDNLAVSSHNCIEDMKMKTKKDLFKGLLVKS